jgi:hypothetical protein
VIAVGVERHDKVGGVVVKGIVMGDSKEEVMLDVLILGAPDFLTMFIDDSVLVRMVDDGSSVGQSSEEVREEFSFQAKREQEDEEDGSGQGRGSDNGNGGFSNGQQEIFYWDFGKQDMLDDLFELEVNVGILVLRG